MTSCIACNMAVKLIAFVNIYASFTLMYLRFFRAVWSCVQCKANYDLDEIEQSLIDAVERKSMGYVLQDLKCTKCNGVCAKII